MKLALPLIPGLALLTILGIGCATQKEPAASSALDIDAPPAKGPAVSRTPPAYTPPVYTPPPARVFTPPPQAAEPQPADEPVATPAAAAPAKPLPKPAAKVPAKADGTYTVQKGDTLFGIARDRYGSGAQWEKIAAANPGVNASSLKVGQKLKMP